MTDPLNYCFTADQHYFHDNISLYAGRPWKNLKQMNSALISLHNEIVAPTDEVFIVGDLTMLSAEQAKRVEKQIIANLNGIKHLILGNHDSWRPFLYVESGFTSVHTAFWFKYHGYKFVIAHDPSVYTIFERDKQTFMLCGHIHKLFKHLLPEKRIINVGVDVWDYKPVRFTQILDLLVKFGWKGLASES